MKSKLPLLLSCVIALSALAGCDPVKTAGEVGSKIAPPIGVYIEPYIPMNVGGREAVVKGFDECPHPGSITDGVWWIPLTAVSHHASASPECARLSPDRSHVDVMVLWLPVTGEETLDPSKETWRIKRVGKTSGFLLVRADGSYATRSTEIGRQ